MAIRTSIVMILCLFLFSRCKEPFNPEIPSPQTNYLVVEGFINAGAEPTSFRLSRTTAWNEGGSFVPEKAASVTVEGDNNTSFLLSDQGNGLYASLLSINRNAKYRIRIKTASNEEFTSDYVDVKITPPIDSINWRLENDALRIFANTHDPENKTRYYTWAYDETWQIRSTFHATYEYKNDQIVDRDLSINIFDCWKYNSSSTILLGSSAKLASDVIFESPILNIEKGAERLGVRYSMLLKQYALPKDAYEFFQLMKKNTEAIGTIFDPQPSLLKTNIRNRSGEKNVIGFVYASTKQEKRIFISAGEIPASWLYRQFCNSFRVANHPDSIKQYMPAHWPYEAERMGPAVAAWLVSEASCVDCRLRNGSNVKPSYW